MRLNAFVKKAYAKTFGEPPKGVRVVPYRACRGGYVKVYPSASVANYLDGRTTCHNTPSTHGPCGSVPDPRLAEFNRNLSEDPRLTDAHLYWRRRQVNTPRAFIDIVADNI